MVGNGLGTGDTMINCITEYLVFHKAQVPYPNIQRCSLWEDASFIS